MTSLPIRSKESDHLITAENAALLVIDYQPAQINAIGSMNRQLLLHNIVGTVNAAKLYGIPIILTTVNVRSGNNEDTVPQVKKHLNGILSIDRTAINPWEDKEFTQAVKATGRKKLIFGATCSEACLTFPALDALQEGHEVYIIVDAVGGSSKVTHKAAINRLEQAGAIPISTVQLFCELQRDWNRTETLEGFMKLFLETIGNTKIEFGNGTDQKP